MVMVFNANLSCNDLLGNQYTLVDFWFQAYLMLN